MSELYKDTENDASGQKVERQEREGGEERGRGKGGKEREEEKGGGGGRRRLTSNKSSTRSVPNTRQSFSYICVAWPLTKDAVPTQFGPRVATTTLW